MDNHLVLPPLNYDPDYVGDISVVGGPTMSQTVDAYVDESLKFFDMGRAADLENAKRKTNPAYDSYVDPYSGESYSDPWKETPRKLLPAEEANRKYGLPENGLTFNEPITEEAARILNSRKKQEIYNQEIIAQAKGWKAVGGFTMGMVASLAQPEQFALNILGGIIAKPILGAKYAAETLAMLNPAARLGSRAIAGSVEGAVGAVISEPIQWAVALNEQADYGMMDTLMNLAGGTVLGGGLHVVGGTTADWVKGLRQQTWSKGLDAAVSQMLNGRSVEVEPLIKQDPSAILKAEVEAASMPGEPAPIVEPSADPVLVSKIKAQLDTLPVDVNTDESFKALTNVVHSGAVEFRVDVDADGTQVVTINGKKYKVTADAGGMLNTLDPTGADKNRLAEAVDGAFDPNTFKGYLSTPVPKKVVLKYGNQWLVINGEDAMPNDFMFHQTDEVTKKIAEYLFKTHGVIAKFTNNIYVDVYENHLAMMGEVTEGVPVGIDVMSKETAMGKFDHKDATQTAKGSMKLTLDAIFSEDIQIEGDSPFVNKNQDIAHVPDEMIAALAGGSISENTPVNATTDLRFADLILVESTTLGSNDGARYLDPTTGIEYYVKRNKTNEQTFTEFAANAIYRALGVVVPNLKRVDFEDGTFGIASEWHEADVVTVKDVVEVVEDMYAPGQADPIVDPWIVDAWLANWDAFADGNIINAFDGLMRIDQGGALEFRAQGGKKDPLSHIVNEIETFFTKNPWFKQILEAAGIPGPKEAVTSLGENAFFSRLLSLKFDDLYYTFIESGYGVDDAKRLTDILIKRREYLVGLVNHENIKVKEAPYRLFHELGSALSFLKKMARHVAGLLTTEEKKSLSGYQSGSTAFNAYLRNKDVKGLKADAFYDERAQILDSAIAKSPSQAPVRVYRWVLSSWFNMDLADFKKALGAFYVDKGFSSTSLMIKSDFSDRDVLFAYDVPEGHGLIPIDAAHSNFESSFTRGEQELLMARNTHTRITSVTDLHDGRIMVTMEVLPDKVAKMDLHDAVKKMIEWQSKPSSAADDTPVMTEEEVMKLLDEIPGLIKKEVPTLTSKIETKEEKVLKEFVQSIEEFFGETEDRAEFDAIMKEFNALQKDSEAYVSAMYKATNCYLGA